eukprot:1302755-Karenia_brevis.AAC.1
MKQKPLHDKPRLVKEVLGVRGGLGLVTQLWATLAALGRKLKNKANAAQRNARHIVEAQISIANMLKPDSADLLRAWEA